MAFSAGETIRRPRLQVWAAATDWSRASQWMKGVDGLRVVQKRSVGVGTKLAFRSRGSERQTMVTAWLPGEKLALCSRQGGITAEYVYGFADCPEGTRVTLDASCRGEGVGWRLAAPFIGFLMAKADGNQLRALKSMIEET